MIKPQVEAARETSTGCAGRTSTMCVGVDSLRRSSQVNEPVSNVNVNIEHPRNNCQSPDVPRMGNY